MPQPRTKRKHLLYSLLTILFVVLALELGLHVIDFVASRVKQSPHQATFTMQLANGYSGYLPTPQQHAWGGYETWPARSSRLEVEAEPKICAAVLQLLKQVKD